MPTYADVLARNVRSARARLDLQQEPLATRMRALGYTAWIRQTVANVEKGRRRLTAEEILGLSLALETTMSSLVASAEEQEVNLPSGEILTGPSVRFLAHGLNDGSVRWEGNTPVFVGPQTALRASVGTGQWVRMSPEAVGLGMLGVPNAQAVAAAPLNEDEDR